MNSSKEMRRLLLCFVLVIILAGSAWLAAGRTAAADFSVPCLDCHDDKQSAKYVHYPGQEGDCQSCHEPTPEHLEHGGSSGMKTNRTASACYLCHDAKNKGKTVHPVLEMDGECIQCHNPHGSDNEKFLVMPIDRLCRECHDALPAGSAAGSKHSVVQEGKGCLNCHDPHSSDQDSLLINSPKTVCLGCHNREIEVPESGGTRRLKNIGQKVMQMAYPHKPATWDDGCVICHKPHGSEYRMLLVEPFPENNFIEYHPGDSKSKNTFELCFTCHNPELLSKDISGGVTGFRNDTIRDGVVVRENLHWFHVVYAAGSEIKARGRSCIICHDPHGTTQPHTINSSWGMSSTYEPVLLYLSRPNGGECIKTCHTQKIYQRLD